MSPRRTLVVAATLLLCAGLRPLEATDPSKPPAEQVDMVQMMERMKQFTATGPEHVWLQRFLGEWQTETRIGMHGPQRPPDKGTSRGRWLIDGRWLVLESEGTMMGMPVKSCFVLGYDRFKMSFVTSFVSSVDTAMTHSEGDIDPKTGALLTYGTLDEYLTGEHDKMVKYVWRFPDENTMILEIHDLPIGETDAKVVEVTYRRKAGSAR
ncbi:MAG TPA: DUF1579 family protein [Thermoanaerobaculia bacterium]|nr:DUF1579 family protein [Thermoanaerobaculia bacterium]